MDYFQGVVAEYLRADRACFINPEFFLPLEPAEGRYDKSKYWYVDVLALHMKQRQAYLCEVTYARKPSALVKRLHAWRTKWSEIRLALGRDAGLPHDWTVQIWIFVPGDRETVVRQCLEQLFPNEHRLTKLEDAVPWKFCTWDRIDSEFITKAEHPTDRPLPPRERS